METKELLKKAFDAGYDCSVSHNCGSCENSFGSFEEFYDSLDIEPSKKVKFLHVEEPIPGQCGLCGSFNCSGGCFK